VNGSGLVIFVLTLLLASGCSNADNNRNEIFQQLTTRTKALNSKNISAYLSVISTKYNDKGKNFNQLKESLDKNFRDFEQLEYKSGQPAITITGNSAESTCSYRLKIKIHDKETTLNGTEHLKLVKEPEGWKIIAGI
jgi:hypothetical protein